MGPRVNEQIEPLLEMSPEAGVVGMGRGRYPGVSLTRPLHSSTSAAHWLYPGGKVLIWKPRKQSPQRLGPL